MPQNTIGVVFVANDKVKLACPEAGNDD